MKNKLLISILSGSTLLPLVISSSISCSSKQESKYYSKIDYSLFNIKAKINVYQKDEDDNKKGIHILFNFIDTFDFWQKLNYNVLIEDQESLIENIYENNIKMTEGQYKTWEKIQRELGLFTNTLLKNKTIADNFIKLNNLYLNGHTTAISYSDAESVKEEFNLLPSERRIFLKNEAKITNIEQYYIFKMLDNFSRSEIAYTQSSRLDLAYIWDRVSKSESEKPYFHSLTESKYYFTDTFEPEDDQRYATKNDIVKKDSNKFFNFNASDLRFKNFMNSEYYLSTFNRLSFDFGDSLTVGDANNSLSGGASSELWVWDSTNNSFITYVKDANSSDLKFINGDNELLLSDSLYGHEVANGVFNAHVFLTKEDAIDSFLHYSKTYDNNLWDYFDEDTEYKYLLDVSKDALDTNNSYIVAHKIIDNVNLAIPSQSSEPIYIDNQMKVPQRGINRKY